MYLRTGFLRLACRRLSYICTVCNYEQKDKNPMSNIHLTHSGQPNQQLVSFWYLTTFGNRNKSVRKHTCHSGSSQFLTQVEVSLP